MNVKDETLDFEPTLELSTPQKKIQITITEEDHERLKELSGETGLTQGDVIRAALMQVEFRATVERLRLAVNPKKFISDLELSFILTAHDAKLITEDELNLLVSLAYVDPPNVAHRLNVLFKRLSDQMRPLQQTYSQRLEALEKAMAERDREKQHA